MMMDVPPRVMLMPPSSPPVSRGGIAALQIKEYTMGNKATMQSIKEPIKVRRDRTRMM